MFGIATDRQTDRQIGREGEKGGSMIVYTFARPDAYPRRRGGGC